MKVPTLQPSANYSNGRKTPTGNSKPDYDYCELLVERVEEAKAAILHDYDDYLHCCFSLSTLGERGRELFHRVGCLSPKYDRTDSDEKFDHCLQKGDGRISVGTFIDMVGKAGIDTTRTRGRKPRNGSGKDRIAKTELVREKLNEYAEFRFNIITQKVEAKFHNPDEDGIFNPGWNSLEDRTLNDIYMLVNRDGLNVSDKMVNTVINSNTMSKPFDPGKEWLDSLPVWDPTQPDHIGELMNLFVFSDESERPFYERYIRKFLINAVALMYGISEDNQIVPILVGDENIGKTYFCKNFMPPVLSQYFRTIPIDTPLSKDLMLSLSECYLICIDEADLSSKKNFSILKAMVSMTKTDERAAYDRFKKERKRKASFIGTTNEKCFLTELDGARRILPVNLASIKFFRPKDINHAGVYAQALYYARQKDVRLSLTKEEVRELKEHNQQYLQTDPIEEAIGDNFRSPLPGERGEVYTATEIFTQIQYSLPKKEANTPAMIGKTLVRMGFTQKKYGGKSVYRLVKISDDEKMRMNNQTAYELQAEEEQG